MNTLRVFLPIDRFQALARSLRLPDHAHGAVLFADVPGFTPLTEFMAKIFGPQRGAEELTNQLNRVYTALIGPVHRYQGSVISFSGDSVNCWFAGDDGRRAGAAGLEMQAAVARLEPFEASGGLSFQPSIKVAIAVGSVRRFLAGDPAIQRMDVLTGSAMEVLEKVGHLVERGMVVMEASAAAQLTASGAGLIFAGEREDSQSDIRAAILTGQMHPIPPDPWQKWEEQADDKPASKASRPNPMADTFQPTEAWLLPAVQQRLQTGSERFLADLRPVTVLFLNFGGLNYDDEEAELLLDAYLRKVQNCLVRYEGAPLQLNTGDKGNYLYAAFGAPLAHDDDAARAVTAALELLQISTEIGFITGARVGIAQGSMYAGAYGSPSRQTYGLIGDKVNVAARLMQLAKPGDVLCDQEVYAQARRYWSFETLPPVQLKGKAVPIQVYRPLRRLPTAAEIAVEPLSPPAQASELAPLVGRQPEIGRIHALLDALQARKSSVLFIEGEAGIGKSRLVAELLAVAKERGLDVLFGSGQSIEQNVPYRAWRDVFQSYFDIHDYDNLTTRQEKVRLTAEAAVPRMLQRLPLLNEVLNMGLPENQLTSILDPKLRRESLFNLLIALLRARLESRDRLDSRAGTPGGPLVLVLEDAHWMDVLSWDLALNLARVMLFEEKPLLLVLVSRPLEETHPGAQISGALRGLPACDVISLEALDDTALVSFIVYHLGISPDRLPSEILQFVQTRSDGNPFFAEELIHTMLDRGLITIEPGEDEIICHACPDLAQAGQSLPGTLQGLILSRIDRLPPEQQLTIKVAAVIGRTFAYTPLRDTLTQFVPVADSVLKGHLSELVRHEMTLLEIPEPELTYVFKHIITQEAAYQSLLYAQRKEIHLAVARWYEALLEADEALAQGILPLLAYHYRQAERAEREQYYARKAGEAAAQVYANDSALAYITRALELTPPEDLESIYALRKLRLGIYRLKGNNSAALDEINRLAEISDQISSLQGGEPSGVEKQADILLQRSRLLNYQGQYEAAEETARQAKALAYQTQNIELQLYCHIELGFVMGRRAEYTEAFQEMQPALELARASGLHNQEARLLQQLGVTAYLSGNRVQAQGFYQQCLLTYRMIGNRDGEGLVLNNLGLYHLQQGNLTAALEYMEQSLAILREIGARSSEVYPLANIANIFYQQRRYEKAISYWQQVLTLARELNLPYVEARTHGNLGNAYQATGNFRLAFPAYDQALAIAQATSDRQEEAYELEDFARAFIQIGDFQAANLYLEKGLRLCKEIGDLEIEAEIEKDQAVQDLWLGSLEQALAHCECALALAQQLEIISGKEVYLLTKGTISLQRNQIEPAEAAYQEAQKIFNETDRPATEVEAGLILVDLARGDISKAAGRAVEILKILENDTVADAIDPAAIYLACYHALQAAGDARSTEALAQGYHFLQSRAEQLTDDQRRMYLDNIPSNRALLALWMNNQTGRSD